MSFLDMLKKEPDETEILVSASTTKTGVEIYVNPMIKTLTPVYKTMIVTALEECVRELKRGGKKDA